MLKKSVVLLSAVLVTLGVVRADDRPFLFCDPVKSTFCGVSSIYEFEESADYARTSEVGGPRFLEPDGADVNASAPTHKTGATSLAIDASANHYVYIPRSSGPSGQFTVGFWIYPFGLPSATTKRVQILSTRDALGNEGYPRVYLYNNAGTVNVRYEVKQGITDTVTTLTNTSQAIALNNWYYVTFGQYPNADSTHPYQHTLWIQTNGGTRDTANITNGDVATVGDFIIGGWLGTSPTEYGYYRLDQFASWSGTFSTTDSGRLYNAGAGCAFPFVATATGC